MIKSFANWLVEGVTPEQADKEIAKMQKGFLIEGDQYVLSALPNVRKESDKIGKALELIFNKPEETKKVESYVVKYDDKIDKDVQSAIDKISIVQVKEILTKIANNLIKQRQETAMNI